MSRTTPQSVPCPDCQTTLEVDLYASVNATRHPELRTAIVDRTFHCFPCACGTTVRLASELSYLDTERKEWLVCRPLEELANWKEQAQATQALFDQALGSGAPGVAQEIGEGISPRLVFGLDALREKLVAAEHGLDDVIVEFVKMTVMKNQAIVPQAGQELRLIDVRDSELEVALLDAQACKVVSSFGVPRALYDEIVSKPEAWAQLRGPLTADPFVDAQKMWYGD